MVKFDLNKLKSLSDDEHNAAWLRADRVLQAATPEELRFALLNACNACVLFSLGSDHPSTVSDLAVYDLAAQLIETYQSLVNTPACHPEKRYEEALK